MPDIECKTELAGSVPPETKVIIPTEPCTWLERLKLHAPVILKLTHPRNYPFFKKWWALVLFAYEQWEPDDTGIPYRKSKDTFRKEITILAGHYEVVASLSGNTVKKVAKSISWANMTEEQFAEFYDLTKDVVWERIFQHVQTYDRDEFERVALELSSF